MAAGLGRRPLPRIMTSLHIHCFTITAFNIPRNAVKEAGICLLTSGGSAGGGCGGVLGEGGGLKQFMAVSSSTRLGVI